MFSAEQKQTVLELASERDFVGVALIQRGAKSAGDGVAATKIT
jgi:hypothetical protein